MTFWVTTVYIAISLERIPGWRADHLDSAGVGAVLD